MGTWILGSYFTDEEIEEITTNPEYKDTVFKAVLDLRKASEELKKALKETWLYRTMVKFLDWLEERLK